MTSQISTEVIEEYKQYIMDRMLIGNFDFNTWYQHQYENVKLFIDVKPSIQFSIMEDKKKS